MTARFYVGDVFEVMASLPDASVDLICTSPPFLALRSYLPADHPDKAKEIGSEPNPAEFIDTMLRLTAEWGRLLAPHGSIAVELGDTYSGSGGAGGDYAEDGWRGEAPAFKGSASKRSDCWPLDKSLALIPQLYAVALSYGINPLTGEPSPAGRWRVRNVVRWCRPNPPVGALGDKFRPATSEMVIATRARDRYFDLDAVREPLTERALAEIEAGGVAGGESYQGEAANGDGYRGDRVRKPAAGGGAPPLDYWVIPTHPYKGSHYATFPPELVVRPIKSMVPEKVCRVCGEPSRRIVESRYVDGCGNEEDPQSYESGVRAGRGAHSDKGDKRLTAVPNTIGWSDCQCKFEPGNFTSGSANARPVDSKWRPGIVLDPFAGSGTTLMVATGHGRDAIGIDLDARNLDLARERVGMFLEAAE